MNLATIRSWPTLKEPVLVIGLEGWIDAGIAGATAIKTLLDSTPHETIATFDSDSLLDSRARRPILRIVNGVHQEMRWPQITLQCCNELDRSLLVLEGPEPDFRWHEFIAEVTSLAARLDVEMVVCLGAFPAPVPHTRPVRLVATSADEEIVGRIGFLPASVEVPAGAGSALEHTFGKNGIPAVGLWARVPHYAAAMPYPMASAALLDELSRLIKLDIDTSALHEAGKETFEQIQNLIAGSQEHAAMVAQLEAQSDSEQGMYATGFTHLPSGDEIAAELERFLRGESR